MREIKFRAKDKVTEKWIYSHGYYYDAFNYWFVLPSDPVPSFLNGTPTYPLAYAAKHIIIPETLGEFTGLKDKDSKAIYEGDVLGGIYGDGYIAYCNKCKSFEYFMNDWGCASCSGDVHWPEIVGDEGSLEVIGNIYENPELLTGDKAHG